MIGNASCKSVIETSVISMRLPRPLPLPLIKPRVTPCPKLVNLGTERGLDDFVASGVSAFFFLLSTS